MPKEKILRYFFFQNRICYHTIIAYLGSTIGSTIGSPNSIQANYKDDFNIHMGI